MTVLECFGIEETTQLAWSVRSDVFVREQKVPIEMERDATDAVSWHVVVMDMSKEPGYPVATGRVFSISDETYVIGRVAVLLNHRGTGLGVVVMEHLLQIAKMNKARKVELHAQVEAKAFYENLGFKEEGATYYEAGIEHITMSIELSQ